ncbi:MAG: NUDIX hydrolase, partial [Syntrophomonadaceae bacterium]|nr:NUDIX hydrolase [Syntrophomonadaceae bacterium]
VMRKIAERTVYEGRWIDVKELDFQADSGEIFTWEKVERPRDNGGMVIIAQLKPSGRILLIRQYRPVLEQYIIGFPGGIAESSDIAAEALRELREESGYAGRVLSVSPDLRNNPALLDETVYLVRMEIDENLPENQAPQQKLEVSEEIELHLKHPDEIPAWLRERHQAGDRIGIGPGYFFGL